MAKEITIGGGGTLFIGEDKVLRIPIVDDAGAAQDITGWTIKFVVRKTDKSTTALISKTATIDGVFSPTANPLRAQITLSDDDLAVTVFTKAGTYRHSWKRDEGGVETLLAYGPFEIERATQV